jgi:L-amino acid N-acyltransferase YncA
VSDLVVRPARADDAVAIQAIYAPYVTDSAISFELEPPTVDQIAARMSAAPRLPWLLATLDADPAGYAYASRHREREAYRWSVDTSIYLAADACGRGIGRRLYADLLEAVTTLGYVNAFAGIALPNEASVRLHEGLDFSLIGTFPQVGYKDGQWRSVGWWWRQLAVPQDEPDEPRPWNPATD